MPHFDCPDVACTERLGACVLGACGPGLILLSGPLGAGKTTLVRGALRAAGHAGTVKSPTFTLVEPYALGALTVYHWDLYRLSEGISLDTLGFRDYLHPGALLFIEWPERSPGLFRQHALALELRPAGDRRSVVVEAGPSADPGLLARLEGLFAQPV